MFLHFVAGFERAATKLRRKRWAAVTTTTPGMAPATPRVTTSCPVKPI